MSGWVMEKAELLAAMQEARADWEALLTEVGEARLAVPNVVGSWAVRDVVAHLTAWERWTVATVIADVRRDQPSDVERYGAELPAAVRTGDTDDFNNWVANRERGRPLATVLAESRAQYERLVELVEGSPDDLLGDPEYEFPSFPWKGEQSLAWVIAQMSPEHYRLHLPPIRAWLDRTIEEG